jgi:hypothetical protein
LRDRSGGDIAPVAVVTDRDIVVEGVARHSPRQIVAKGWTATSSWTSSIVAVEPRGPDAGSMSFRAPSATSKRLWPGGPNIGWPRPVPSSMSCAPRSGCSGYSPNSMRGPRAHGCKTCGACTSLGSGITSTTEFGRSVR